MTVMAAKAAFMDPPMEAVSAARPQGSTLARVLRGLRPTAPAAFAGFALGLSFALLMPMAWLSAICWNLYLDKLNPIFVEPIGNSARIGVGIGLGMIAMLLAAALVLALATPAGQAWLERFRRPAAANDFSDFVGADEAPIDLPRRRSADIHPDAPPVAPINALRDLPAEGLGPVAAVSVDEPAAEAIPADTEFEALDLTAFAEATDLAAPEPADTSLGAMVARLEAGLARRDAVMPEDRDANSDSIAAPTVDLALEAALSTLARMNKKAVG